MNRIWTLVLVCVVVFPYKLPADITNGDFSYGLDGWTEDEVTVDSGKALFDELSPDFDPDYPLFLRQEVTLQPGLNVLSFGMEFWSGGIDESDHFEVLFGTQVLYECNNETITSLTETVVRSISSPNEQIDWLQFQLLADGEESWTTVRIDNVRLEPASIIVPAPASLILALFGAVLAGRVKKTMGPRL